MTLAIHAVVCLRLTGRPWSFYVILIAGSFPEHWASCQLSYAHSVVNAALCRCRVTGWAEMTTVLRICPNAFGL